MTKKWRHHDPTCVQLKIPLYLLTYLGLFTYSLTPWSRVILEKLTGSQLVRKFHAFYGIRRFITSFTSARRLSYSSEAFVNVSFHDTFFRWGVVNTSPNPKAGGNPLSPVRHCLFSKFAATLHIGDCSFIRNLTENTIMYKMSADYRFKVDGVNYILVVTSRDISCVHARALKSTHVHLLFRYMSRGMC
jgi:hypothetical protein